MITSIKNEYIKNILKLKLAKEIKAQELYLVEGEHLVKEAYKYNLLKEVLVTKSNNIKFDVGTTLITDEIMTTISNLKSIPSVIGVVKFQKNNLKIKDKILLLDNIADPGNLGTIIRSAKAFNVDTIIMSLDCVSLYNEKVLRSTQGLHFNIDIIRMDIFSAIEQIKSREIPILATIVSKSKNIKDISLDKWALVVGNEGTGVKEQIVNLADIRVNVTMNDECESLNVSIATAICLYELNNE